MKKFVSIVLTTGLLMGTVAFGALACDRRSNWDRICDQKQMERRGPHQPPMGQWEHRKKVIVIREVRRTAPIPGPWAMKSVPAPEHDHGFRPQPRWERPGCRRPLR